MSYLWNEWKRKFWTYVIGAAFFAAMPWTTGPYWLNFAAIFLVTYILLALWQIARTVWLTVWRRLPGSDK